MSQRFELKRKILIRKGESKYVDVAVFKLLIHAQEVMQLMNDYGAGYGLYILHPKGVIKQINRQRELQL